MLGTDQSSGYLPSEKWRLAARSTAQAAALGVAFQRETFGAGGARTG